MIKVHGKSLSVAENKSEKLVVTRDNPDMMAGVNPNQS